MQSCEMEYCCQFVFEAHEDHGRYCNYFMMTSTQFPLYILIHVHVFTTGTLRLQLARN